MSVYGYARVSTTRSAERGESLDVQQRMIQSYAAMNGLVLAAMFIERGVSGSKPFSFRPEGSHLLSIVKAGDIIVTTKLDRAFRSSVDALKVLDELKSKGASLHMIDLGGDVMGNGISRMVFTMLSAVAESERDRIRERIADVKNDQRQRGRYLGGRKPFGFSIDDDGCLVVNRIEQNAIAKMKILRSVGGSYRQIAAMITSEYGFDISFVSVKNIIERHV